MTDSTTAAAHRNTVQQLVLCLALAREAAVFTETIHDMICYAASGDTTALNDGPRVLRQCIDRIEKKLAENGGRVSGGQGQD